MDDVADGTQSGSKWARIALLGCCVLAAILAGSLVASFGSGGIAGSPIDSVLPGEDVYHDYVDDPNEAGLDAVGERRGGLGALNPGEQTGVGGELGFDNETFGSTDTELHFTVESSQPTYWRTGSFDRYTGSGWEQTGEAHSYEEPIETEGIVGEQITYDVELEQSARALPTAWRPTTVSGVSDLEVTDDGSIRASEPLSAGTSFSGVSHAPERDVSLLEASGTAYPPEISNRYTQLPDQTPDRVATFTDNITAEADNPYETAQLIQDWLRYEKSYSLEASAQSEHITDTFLFEMEAGYCEYFATAMTTMLRTQDIPARYTVGYSTGDAVEENLFEVRAMNAHAWVEVYFEDFGWVKFDPTPGDSRLAAQENALEESDPNAEYNVSEPGSPGEVFEPGDIQNNETEDIQNGENGQEENGETGENGDNGIQTSLDRTPVPGEEVIVEVTEDGEPASMMAVSFNDELVGVTDGSGTVIATVPHVEELRIGVEEIESIREEGQRDDLDSRSGSATVSAGSTISTRNEQNLPTQSSLREDHEDVYEVETSADISISGEIVPGGEITVTALVADVPVKKAAVTINGSLHGRTNEHGRVTLQLPESPGPKSIQVERTIITGEEIIEISDMEIRVESNSPVLLPYTTVSIQAQYENKSVVDAPVMIDGETVATTGSNGAATVRLPFTSEAVISVGGNHVQTEKTVDGMIRNLFLVGFFITGIVAVVTLSFRRARSPIRSLLETLVTFPHTIATLTVNFLVGISTNRDAYIQRFQASVTNLYNGLRSVIQREYTVRDIIAGVLSWLANRRQTSNTKTENLVGEDEAGSAIDMSEPTSIREAWRGLLRKIDREDASTQTPGELATFAINREGLPSQSVESVRDAYRDVEYGSRSESDHLESVRTAVESIEASDSGSSSTRATAPSDSEASNRLHRAKALFKSRFSEGSD